MAQLIKRSVHSAYEDGQSTSIYGQSEHHIFLDITLWLDP